MGDMYSWRDFSFRRHIVDKMVNVVREGKKNIPNSIIEEMESNIFDRSRDKEDYLDLTAKLLLTLKELRPNDLREEQTQSSSSNWRQSPNSGKLPSLLEVQVSEPSGKDTRARHSSSVRSREELRYKDRQDYTNDRLARSPRNSDRERPHNDVGDRRNYHDRHISEPEPNFSGYQRTPEVDRGQSGYYKNNDRNGTQLFDPKISSTFSFESSYGVDRREYPSENRRSARESNFSELRYNRPEIEHFKERENRVRTTQNVIARGSSSSERAWVEKQRLTKHNDPGTSTQSEVDSTTRRKLSGAATKRLKRLVSEGMPYESARKMLMEEREKREMELRQQKYPSKRLPEKRTPTSSSFRKPEPLQKTTGIDFVPPRAKRPLSPTPRIPNAKKIQPNKNKFIDSSKTQQSVKNDNLEVGIVDKNYPEFILSTERLHTLQREIMKAIEDIPDNGPQVRFQECTYHPGMLLLKCADRESRNWLLKNVDRFRPWEGVRLKTLTGNDASRPNIFTALIPDDVKGTKLSEETVLTRLKKMNHGLLTDLWKILNIEGRKTGHIYTFSVDNDSFKILRDKLKLKPYFGFGQIEFRSKTESKRQ